MASFYGKVIVSIRHSSLRGNDPLATFYTYPFVFSTIRNEVLAKNVISALLDPLKIHWCQSKSIKICPIVSLPSCQSSTNGSEETRLFLSMKTRYQPITRLLTGSTVRNRREVSMVIIIYWSAVIQVVMKVKPSSLRVGHHLVPPSFWSCS